MAKGVTFLLQKVSIFENESREYRAGDSKWPDYVKAVWVLSAQLNAKRTEHIKDFKTKAKAMKYIRRMKSGHLVLVYSADQQRVDMVETGSRKKRKRSK